MAAVQLAIGQLAIDRAERRICKVVAQWFRAHMGRGLGTISIGTKKIYHSGFMGKNWAFLGGQMIWSFDSKIDLHWLLRPEVSAPLQNKQFCEMEIYICH